MNKIYLRKVLDSLALNYNKEEFLSTDPIEFPLRYSNAKEREVVGFISALFSYGNVKAIRSFLNKLFTLMEGQPLLFLKEGLSNTIHKKLPSYRFQTSKDIELFLRLIQILFFKYGTFEKYFLNSQTLQSGIYSFQKILSEEAKKLESKNLSYGLSFLLGKGKVTASNKRYYMFLRWMVRNSFPDMGIYRKIKSANLIYPVDIHIQRIARLLGFSTRKTVDYTLAKEITANFCKINAEDPLLYDFALTRLGITRYCQFSYSKSICLNCKINTLCTIYTNKGNI